MVSNPQTRRVPTFAELAEQEPALLDLLQEIQAEDATATQNLHYCANFAWVTRFKPRLLRLVGWERPDRRPGLSGPAAYDVAYDVLYDALPNCRKCGCL